MRIIEITDDNSEYKELDYSALPLEVSFINEQIIIDSCGENQSAKICGYIAHDQHHLFFQPEENNDYKIYHNDEYIKNSVWLKSGDRIQIEQKIISIHISGDRVKIFIEKKIKKPQLQSPAIAIQRSAENEKNQQIFKTQAIEPAKKTWQNFIIYLVLLLMILVALFVLFSETVEVKIQPDADKVSLQGRFPVLTIHNRYMLIAGQYNLSAEKKGYQQLNKPLNIDSQHKQFSFAMKEQPGIVKFNIVPQDNNSIFLNGVLLSGTADQQHTQSLPYYKIDKGKYRLVIDNPRYKKFEQTIDIKGKLKRQKFIIELEKNWAYATLRPGQINTRTIISNTSGTEQLFDKTISTDEKIELPAGEYRLKASKNKFKELSINFTINAGDDIVLDKLILEEKDGIVNLTSIPEKSIINLDGVYQGKTPKLIYLSANKSHYLELSLAGYQTKKIQLKLKAEEKINKKLYLKQNKNSLFLSVSPQQAKLYIDGVLQKNNSGQFNLTAKNHLLKVQAKGYQSIEKKIQASIYNKAIAIHLSKNKPSAKLKKSVISNKTNKAKNYINSIAQQMIYVPPAVFTMGSKKNSPGRNSNEREQKIKISYGYYLSAKEVTNKQYREFNKTHDSGQFAENSLNSDLQPVVNVSWQEAAEFANWLSKKESLNPYYISRNGKLLPADISAFVNGYRLPFEAEWVLAARGKNQKKYPWAGSYPPKKIIANYADESAALLINNIITGYKDNFSVSSPVGSFIKNEMGFYDLGGNVSEWCGDFYSPVAVQSAKKISINPTGPKKGSHHVVRDASWRDASIRELRLSYRSYNRKKANDIGFRLARYAP